MKDLKKKQAYDKIFDILYNNYDRNSRFNNNG